MSVALHELQIGDLVKNIETQETGEVIILWSKEEAPSRTKAVLMVTPSRGFILDDKTIVGWIKRYRPEQLKIHPQIEEFFGKRVSWIEHEEDFELLSVRRNLLSIDELVEQLKVS